MDQLTQVDSIQRRLLINFDLNLLISSSVFSLCKIFRDGLTISKRFLSFIKCLEAVFNFIKMIEVDQLTQVDSIQSRFISFSVFVNFKKS